MKSAHSLVYVNNCPIWLPTHFAPGLRSRAKSTHQRVRIVRSVEHDLGCYAVRCSRRASTCAASVNMTNPYWAHCGVAYTCHLLVSGGVLGGVSILRRFLAKCFAEPLMSTPLPIALAHSHIVASRDSSQISIRSSHGLGNVGQAARCPPAAQVSQSSGFIWLSSWA